MRLSSDIPSWEWQSRQLSQDEANDPMLAIHLFFDYANLPQVRDRLWESMEAMVTGSFTKSLSFRERIDLLHFHGELQRLVEATHVVLVQWGLERAAMHRRTKEGGS